MPRRFLEPDGTGPDYQDRRSSAHAGRRKERAIGSKTALWMAGGRARCPARKHCHGRGSAGNRHSALAGGGRISTLLSLPGANPRFSGTMRGRSPSFGSGRVSGMRVRGCKGSAGGKSRRDNRGTATPGIGSGKGTGSSQDSRISSSSGAIGENGRGDSSTLIDDARAGRTDDAGKTSQETW